MIYLLRLVNLVFSNCCVLIIHFIISGHFYRLEYSLHQLHLLYFLPMKDFHLQNLCAEGKARRTNASSGCPMLRNHKLQKQFKNQVSQQEALDIEDLVHLGKGIGTCPYYGSRSMVPAANLVALPYQSLLSRSSRESLGLNLKNGIVIIDEAHNLADSLISIYDAKITLSQVNELSPISL